MKVPVRNYQLTDKQIDTIKTALYLLANSQKGQEARYTRQTEKSVALQMRKHAAGVQHVGNQVVVPTS